MNNSSKDRKKSKLLDSAIVPNSYFKIPHFFDEVLRNADGDHSKVVLYLYGKAKRANEHDPPDLNRGQLKTSKRKIAKDTNIEQTKVYRVLTFLRRRGLIKVEIIKFGNRSDKMLITLLYYGIGEEGRAPRISSGKPIKVNHDGKYPVLTLPKKGAPRNPPRDD